MEDPNGPQTKKQKLTVIDAFLMNRNDDYKLVRLTYISKPTRKLAEEEKVDLLNVAKRRNAEMSVTGILFLADDLYLQTLEGPRVALLELLQRLNRDGRHTKLTITSIEYIELRIYPRWSMERVQLSEDSLFIMNNLFNTIVSSFDVLSQYSQQSVIMDWLSSGDPKLAKVEPIDEKKSEEVILVCDIVSYGFSFQEELDTKQYVHLVNTFLKTCSDVITGFRGIFTKYIGDTAIGIFPLEHIENAVAAATEIQRLLAQTREKASADFTDPEQILFAGIGIDIGRLTPLEPSEDRPTSVQEKNFMDFFGTSLKPKVKNIFSGAAKSYGYEPYEGEALEIAFRLKRATTHYRLPVLMTEKVRNEYVTARKKSLGLQPYAQQIPSKPSSSPKIFQSSSPVTPATPANELELSLVGTVKVPAKQTLTEATEETNISVYAPSTQLHDQEPFRTASDKISEWQKNLEQLRYAQL